MPEPSSLSAFLTNLADSLSVAVAGAPGGLLVHVTPATDGYDMGVAPLDGNPPADVLLGMVAPEHWCALGVASRAWARPLDGEAKFADPTPAGVVVLVTRSGEIVSRVRQGERVLTEAPAYGRTLDGLQRALGLPTAPPDVPPTVLFAAIWLERVLEAMRPRRRRLTWHEIRDLHPAFDLLGDNAPTAAEDFLLTLKALAQACDWDRLRWLTVEGSWDEPSVTPSHAAWFDAGSFARWVLGEHRPLSELVTDAFEVLSPGDARRCAQVLRQIGVVRKAA